MGRLVNGRWQADDGTWASKDGAFHRTATAFHGRIGDPRFPAEEDRYHLYVSLACPWAHRTLIFRKLKGLERLIPGTVVHPHMLEHGWEFRPDPEPLYGFRYLHQLYSKAVPDYSGRVNVPVLWDKKHETIVCNESAEIIRMFNSAFDHLTGNRMDFYPHDLRSEIDAINDFVYENVNDGVYKCGFATAQSAYDAAFDRLFAALDTLEERLDEKRYLVGERITEADWRLFTTLIRFDTVYCTHFKCNRDRILDMPNLWGYLRDLYQQPGVAETVNFWHIKQHYFVSHASINPTRIVPKGPCIDFTSPHGRG